MFTQSVPPIFVPRLPTEKARFLPSGGSACGTFSWAAVFYSDEIVGGGVALALAAWNRQQLTTALPRVTPLMLKAAGRSLRQIGPWFFDPKYEGFRALFIIDSAATSNDQRDFFLAN